MQVLPMTRIGEADRAVRGSCISLRMQALNSFLQTGEKREDPRRLAMCCLLGVSVGICPTVAHPDRPPQFSGFGEVLRQERLLLVDECDHAISNRDHDLAVAFFAHQLLQHGQGSPHELHLLERNSWWCKLRHQRASMASLISVAA
jgi:hypothetical protein